MNSSLIRQRRIARLSRYAQAKSSPLLDKVLNMSEEEKTSAVRQFVSQNGIKGLFDLVRNFMMEVRSSGKKAPPAAITAQMYQGKSQDRLTPAPDSGIPEDPNTNKLKTLFSNGDWTDGLLFMILLGTAGGLDQNTLDMLDAFFLSSGTAFLHWLWGKFKGNG